MLSSRTSREVSRQLLVQQQLLVLQHLYGLSERKARAGITSTDLGTSRSRSALEGRSETNSARPSAYRGSNREGRETVGRSTEETRTERFPEHADVK